MNFILEVAFQLSFFQSFPFPSRRRAALCRLQGAKPLREPPPHDAKRGKEKEEGETEQASPCLLACLLVEGLSRDKTPFGAGLSYPES